MISLRTEVILCWLVIIALLISNTAAFFLILPTDFLAGVGALVWEILGLFVVFILPPLHLASALSTACARKATIPNEEPWLRGEFGIEPGDEKKLEELLVKDQKTVNEILDEEKQDKLRAQETSRILSISCLPALCSLITEYAGFEAETIQQFLSRLPVIERKRKKGYRYCKSCLKYKPDRCHHCSVCNSCTLRMEMHVPFLRTCCGAHNLKSYLLWVGYLCLWGLLSLAFQIWCTILLYKHHSTKYAIIGFAVTALLALLVSVITVLRFWYHIYLLARGQTVIDFRERVLQMDYHIYVLKYRNSFVHNFLEVFGTNPCLWFIPYGSVQEFIDPQIHRKHVKKERKERDETDAKSDEELPLLQETA